MLCKIEDFYLLVACIATLLFPFQTYSQTLKDAQVNQVDLSQFAPHPNIVQIQQDNRGFIWFASDFGLYRFDGIHVIHYTKTDYPDLPSNYIYSIIFDYDDKLWIASDGGLAVMDTDNEIIVPHRLEPQNASNENLIPTHLFLATDSTIWVGLDKNRIACIHDKTGLKTYEYQVPDSPFENCFKITRIAEDNRRNIFLKANCVQTDIYLHLNSQGDPKLKLIHKAYSGTSLLFTSGNTIFVMDYSGVHLFNTDLRQLDQHSDKSLFDIVSYTPVHLAEEDKTSFWVGGKEGQLARSIFTQDTLYTEHITKVPYGPVQYITNDMSGCVWLGTVDGVFFVPHRNARFQSHFSSTVPNERYGIKMRAIVEDWDGLIYACTNYGLYRLNPFTSETQRLRPEQNLSLPYSMCLSIENYLWVGSDGYGLMKFDPRKNLFYDRITIYSNSDHLRGSSVSELVIDSDSTLWVGTNNGISYKGKDDDHFHLTRDLNKQPLLPNVFIHDIKELRKGQYWLGTSHGLFQITRVGRMKETYFILSKYKEIPYKIREIYPTPGPVLWLATEDAGLIRFDPIQREQLQFTESNGLPSDVLYSLLPGQQGELWIGTLDGLSRFDTTTQLFNNYYIADGLPHNEFNSQSQLISNDGTYYMGTQNGMVSFIPETFTLDSSDLPIMINSLVKYNTRHDSTFVESRYGTLIDGIRIGPHDNLVTINYSLADFSKLDGNRFQYFIEGVSKKWHYVSNETELVLPHLPAGDYKLLIRGSGSDGRWSNHQAILPIDVRAAYYNTWWFSLSILFVLVLIMWMIHRYRLSQVLKLQKVRWRIAEDLHDELGSSLMGIGIQTEILTATESSSKRVSKLREISGHIQEAVSKLSDIVWSLQSDSGSLGDLMDRIEEQTHILLDPGKINCHTSLPRDENELKLNDVIKQNSFLIFKEALTNIVKHSNANRVDITMQCKKKGLFMSIADNGSVTSPDNPDKGGNGLKNMQRRAKKMLGELTISHDNGFRIELIVPNAFEGW